MSFLSHLWQTFLALHPWGYVSTAVVLLVAFLKRKAISAAISTGWKKLDLWFWGWVKGKVQTQPQTAERGQIHTITYRGTFQDYYYKSDPIPLHFLEITSDGSLLTVPVWETHLLDGIKSGTIVEIDTEATFGSSAERVKRVRRPRTT
jgi:hypothetical protein